MSDTLLRDDYLDDTAPKESMRAGFGRGLVTAGHQDDRVVAMVADLTESLQMQDFRDTFGARFIEVGVAEQNLVTVASGLANMGKIPFAGSYAAFSPGRNWEQIRTTICINNQPVKIVGSHAGLNVGPDGATHQMLEDIALMRVLPRMVVIAPGDSFEAEQATVAMAQNNEPNYLRLAREKTPLLFTDAHRFEIGKAYVLREGSDIALVSTGTMTHQALLVAEQLAQVGKTVEVVHVPTIKPLDIETILASAEKCGRVVTLEEAQIAGGFGSAIAELLAERAPMPVKRIGVNDAFGESGTMQQLWQKHHLDVASIVKAIDQFF